MNISSAAVIEGACTLGASKSKRSPASRTACAVVEPNVPILISFCSKSGKFFFKEDTPAGLKNTLHKVERLDKKKIIEKMFAGGSRSFSVFPLRVVYLPVEELEADASILISVSKRRFKRAVKRNRVKRQIREAYRVNKHELLNALAEKKCRLAIAFIYLSDQLKESSVIEERVKTALARIVEKVTVSDANVAAVAPMKP